MNQIETGVDRLVKLVNSEKKISVENAAKTIQFFGSVPD